MTSTNPIAPTELRRSTRTPKKPSVMYPDSSPTRIKRASTRNTKARRAQKRERAKERGQKRAKALTTLSKDVDIGVSTRPDGEFVSVPFDPSNLSWAENYHHPDSTCFFDNSRTGEEGLGHSTHDSLVFNLDIPYGSQNDYSEISSSIPSWDATIDPSTKISIETAPNYFSSYDEDPNECRIIPYSSTPTFEVPDQAGSNSDKEANEQSPDDTPFRKFLDLYTHQSQIGGPNNN